MYPYLFAIILLASIILFLYKRRRASKFKSAFKDINDIARRAIMDNEQIAYSDEDAILYLGSIINDAEEYSRLKQISHLTEDQLLEYFKTKHYKADMDCLNIYRLTKHTNHDSYLIVINDPVDMNLNFSLFEVLGPFAKG